MAKDRKFGVMWKLLFGIVACLSFASLVLSDSSKPLSYNCNKVRLPDGTMLQTVPKHFSPPAAFAGKFPGKQIICRMPDCGKNICNNGWCEETMEGYNCHCSSGFQGKLCDELSFQYEHDGSFYHFSTRQMNYSSAFSACSQYGFHLVFIQSEEEWDFIVGYDSEKTWIGLTGTNWLAESEFNTTNPDGFHEDGRCALIGTFGQLYWSWGFKDCSKQFRYICEKEVGK